MSKVQINGPRIGASADLPADPKEMATLEGSILRVQELGEALSDPELIQTLKTVDDHGIIVNALEGFAVEMAVSLEPTQAWIKQFGTSSFDSAIGISTSGSANIYVTGRTDGSLLGNSNFGLYDAFLTQYDSSGTQKWVKQLGSSGSDISTGISSENNLNVYVVGYTDGSFLSNINLGSNDAYLAKYDASGNQLWVKQFGSSDTDFAQGISIDNSGNVYVTGSTLGSLFGNSSFGDYDAYVAKYDVSGNQVWIEQFGTSEFEYATGIGSDNDGNVYVTGFTYGALADNSNSGLNDAYIAKYDASGNQVWIKQFGTSSFDEANGISTDSNGNIYITGYIGGEYIDGEIREKDFFIAKYDKSGNQVWIKPSGASEADEANGVSTDSGGNVFVTGYTEGSLLGNSNLGGRDAFVAKYDASGNQIWVKQFGTSTTDEAEGISTDSNGNVYISGLTYGSLPGNSNLGSYDAFIVGFDADGNLLNPNDEDLPAIALTIISPASVSEDGVSNLVYTFTRTGSLTDPLTVNYAIGGTATNGTDYVTFPTSVTFLANSDTATVIVDPTADTTVEPDETVSLTLSSGTEYQIETTTPAVGIITNDDVLPVISLAISPASVSEDGVSNLVYTFTRTGSLTNPLTLNYTIAGTATNGTDYVTILTSVTFLANSDTATVIVDPTADTTVEPDETVSLTLSSGTEYEVETTTPVAGTIINDVPAITLTVSPASVREDGVSNLVYTFARTSSLADSLTVDYIIGGTAINGTDYASIPTSVTFLANSDTATVIVDPTVDTTVEPAEAVSLTLTSVPGYAVDTTKSVVGTITDKSSGFIQFGTSSNDSASGISIDRNGNVYVIGTTSGNLSGNGNLGGSDAFVAKYDPQGNQLWVKQFGSSGNDYGVLISTDGNGNVYVNGGSRDNSTIDKYDTNGNQLRRTSFGTDSHLDAISTDSSGNLYVGVKASPSTSDFADFQFVYVLKFDAGNNQKWDRPIALNNNNSPIDTEEIDGISTDSNGNMYIIGRVYGYFIRFTPPIRDPGDNRVIVFSVNPPYSGGILAKYDSRGNQVWSKFIGVDGNISTDISGNSYVVFKGVSADGLGRIEKYDANGNRLWVSEFDSCDPDLSQGISTDNNGNIYVTGYTNVAKYDTNGNRLWIKNLSTSDNDKATGISTDSSGNIYISGYTTGSLLGNINLGGSDAFIFKLDSDGNQLNNDGLPCIKLTISPDEVIEDEDRNLVYTFTRTGSLDNALTVSYTIGGTATNGTDYTTIPASVTFLANSAIATVIVDPIADTSLELDETVSITLNSGAAYTMGTKGAVFGTIVNDEAVVTLSVSPDNVPEDGLGNLVYTFTRTGYLANPLTVSYTISGTAINGTDYATISTSVTFLANSSIATVIVDPTDDTKVEPDKTIILSLQENNNYYIGTPSPVVGTIVDDDIRIPSHALLEIFAKKISYSEDLSPGSDLSSILRSYNYPGYSYVIDSVFSDSKGFYALGLTSPDASPILVLRGTGDLSDVLDDLNPIGVGFGQFYRNKDRLNQWLNSKDKPYISGHSLGGALAQWVGSDFTNNFDKSLGEIVTFNSPGIAKEITFNGRAYGSDLFNKNDVKGVTHYITSSDAVSMAGSEYLEGEYYLSNPDSEGIYGIKNVHLAHVLNQTEDTLPGSYPFPGNFSFLNSPFFSYIPDIDFLLTQLALAYIPVKGPAISAALSLRSTAESFRKTTGFTISTILQTIDFAAVTSSAIFQAAYNAIVKGGNAALQAVANWGEESWKGFVSLENKVLEKAAQWTEDSWLNTKDWAIDTWFKLNNLNLDIPFLSTGKQSVLMNQSFTPQSFARSQVQFSRSLDTFTTQNSNSYIIQVAVSIFGVSDEVISIDFQTVSGTALAGQDYIPVNGTLIFQPGETQKLIDVELINFDFLGQPKTLNVNLSNPQNVQFLEDQEITVFLNPNLAPTVTKNIEDQSIIIGKNPFFYIPFDTFSDPNFAQGDALTYVARLGSGNPIPAWLTFNSTDLTFSGTPTSDNFGIYIIVLTATDSSGATASDIFRLTVLDPLVTRPIASNSIIGSSGFGNESWLTPDQILPYTIRFENQSTEPALSVTITQQLDSDLDLTTFELGDFGFGDFYIDIPDNLQSYTTGLDLGSSIAYYLYFEASLDLITRTVTWKLTTIDPLTGRLTEGVTDGFLPPNNANHDGEGFVNYRINAKANLATGAVIDAEASIVFDTNEPIKTPAIFNTIDVGQPNSAVITLPETVGETFTVTWGGSDDGSGIVSYDIFVSVNGGVFTLWQDNIAATSATYTGDVGKTYAFYSAAKDGVGYTENAPLVADAKVTVVASNKPPVLSAINKSGDEDASIAFTAADFSNAFAAADILTKIKLVSLPASGSLTLNGVAASVNQEVVVADLGQLRFDPDPDFNGSLSFEWTGFDGKAFATPAATVNLAIASVNDAPNVLTAIPAQRATAGTPFRLLVPDNAFRDGDVGDALIYSATLANGDPLPGWLAFEPTTRTFSGTPAQEDAASLRINIRATDRAGASASLVFVLAIATTNQPPSLSGAPASITYTELSPATAIDPSFTLADPDAAKGFAGGFLEVAFTSGGTAADRLSVLDQGTSSGQIGVLGTKVIFGGSEIGQIDPSADGLAGSALRIAFAPTATLAAIQALGRAIAFSNSSNNPSTSRRTLSFRFDDGGNGGDAPLQASRPALIDVLAFDDPLPPPIPPLSMLARLTGRPTSANALYLLPSAQDSPLSLDAIRSQARLLFQTLESSNTPDLSAFRFERRFQTPDFNDVRFFEVVDSNLQEVLAASSSVEVFQRAVRWLTPQQSGEDRFSLRSDTGLSVELENDPGSAALQDLLQDQIANLQEKYPVLDFRSTTGPTLLNVSIGREAGLNSSINFYRILDADGTVLDPITGALLRPGASGYDDAALHSSNRLAPLADLTVSNNQTLSFTTQLDERALVAPVATVSDGQRYFAFAAANLDGIQHWTSLGANLFGLEDLYDGGDRDFDDAVIAIRATAII